MHNTAEATRHAAQPSSLEKMDPYRDADAKRGVQQEQGCCYQCRAAHDGPWPASGLECQECSSSSSRSDAHQNRCHRSRLRRVLLPALAALLTLSFVLAMSCLYDAGALFGLGAEGLARRATGDAAGDNGGTFVDNKLYLIVVFVGLLIVIILGIMLSAWCCRGVFENPLCCPCYLCACCGGLACLECIGCGLCASGLSEV